MAGERPTRVERMRLQLRAVEALRALKRGHTYSRLSGITGVPITVLNRYVRGRVVPSEAKALELVRALGERFPLSEAVRERLGPAGGGGAGRLALLWADTALLGRAADEAARACSSADAVLTADGAALASLVATRLGARTAVASRAAPSQGPDARRLVFADGLCVPRDVLGQGDSVLVVEPALDGGATLRCLARLAERAGARVERAFVPVAREGWRRGGDEAFPVTVVAEVQP